MKYKGYCPEREKIYTGLCDRNGERIYADDIVSAVGKDGKVLVNENKEAVFYSVVPIIHSPGNYSPFADKGVNPQDVIVAGQFNMFVPPAEELEE